LTKAYTTRLDTVCAALDADPAFGRTAILRATSQELGQTRQADGGRLVCSQLDTISSDIMLVGNFR
jgi:hypothetical protein